MMIVIGYQGIGKSSLAGNGKFIDLESGSFWVDGKRDSEWYKPYCQIALHLHHQGFIVFVSSHESVRNYLKEIAEDERNNIFVCFPDRGLKQVWIKRLKTRWEESGLEKDYKAYMNAKECFDKNINDLQMSGFKCIHIDVMQYNLETLIKERINSENKNNGLHTELCSIICENIYDECIAHCNYGYCHRVKSLANDLIENGVTI